MKTLHLNFDNALDISKAIANKHRMEILKILSEKPHNVNELAEKLNLPFSTTAANVKKLEDVNLISTEMVPGRGTQKVNSINYDRIMVELFKKENKEEKNEIIMEMPIGEFVDCQVKPSCGIVGEDDYIGIQDDPRSFYEPDRKKAQLIFFRDGYVEYRFPNRLPRGTRATEFEFTAEICSEAPYHKLDWPSDITLWVNGVEAGTWTSPSDFGGERGFLTPDWWLINYTQYGMLKNFKITEQGCFLDGMHLKSDTTIKDLNIHEMPFISIKLGIKKDAVNRGGLNLFGAKFGNYDQDLLVRMRHSQHSEG
ncbi:helix-turn-helix domain-containing protein [Salipaludibacillus sp. CUR1]|uniref:ArsR/SmtB family transcription factor n=1 Tax=Salipaludibacillus sp. CUR1 TaxID=2820003 RepID=UPI001E4EE5B7|nr:helix-turn-helix domain-containing protein [Salipaludibacillus sp. CUR1]MCE7791760.1 helix-turn-helix domain-containing protein [Salipaludibacillus sp. CUR1]